MITIKKGLVLLLALLLTLFLGTVVMGAETSERGYFGTDYDFGGETVTFWNWGDWLFERFEEGEIAEGRVEEAEELFNVNIEFEVILPQDRIETYTSRLLAGESTHDVWHAANRVGYYELLAIGGLYPLSDILPEEYYDGLRRDTIVPIETMAYQGKKYALGSPAATYGIDTDFIIRDLYFMYYNKDMIEEAGLPDPYDLYREGDWTYETFTELAREVTTDTTGDGDIDQYGMQNIGWMYEQWPHTNNGNFIEEQDGEYVVTLDLPENREAILQLREWGEVEEITGGNFAQGTAAFITQGLWMIESWMEGDGALDFNFGIVPKPMGPHADENLVARHSLDTWVIPINSAQPEAKVALHEFLFWDDEETVSAQFQRELPDLFPERRYAELAINESREWDGVGTFIKPGEVEDLIRTGSQGWAQHGINAVIMDNMEWSTMVDEVEPLIQAVLDDFFDQ